MTNANVLQIIQNIHENLTTTHTVTHIYIWDIIKISTYQQITLLLVTSEQVCILASCCLR